MGRALGIGRGEREDDWLVVVKRELVQNRLGEETLRVVASWGADDDGGLDQVDHGGEVGALVVLVGVRNFPDRARSEAGGGQ